MRPPIVVNEANDEGRVGAVYVFASQDDAEGYLEPWYVDIRHWAYDADGQPLKVLADGLRTKVVVDASRTPVPEVLRNVLIGFLTSLPLERAAVSELGVLSLNELIEKAMIYRIK
jgi:hypothetical protein